VTHHCVRLATVAVLFAAATCARSAEPLAVLGQPGLAGRFDVLADGSVRTAPDGPVLSEWLVTEAPGGGARTPPSVTLSWLAPGARVVESVRTVDDVRLTTLSGADGHGPVGKQSLWLFRSVRLGAKGGERRTVRLFVSVSHGGLALRDDLALVDGEDVLLVVSRRPDEVQEAGGETILAFDLTLAAKGSAGLLLAAPAAPARYRFQDVPDVRDLDPDFCLGGIVDNWEGRVLPDRLTLGSARVTEAFHAAAGSLLLGPPAANDPQAVALALCALARAGHGPQLSRALETLVAGQGEDGRFAGAADLGLQADLATAVADYAMYSDAPERWAHLVWRPVSRSAQVLETSQPPPEDAPRVALALSRAADVASAVGEGARADELRTRVQALLEAEPGSAPVSLFGVRAEALRLLATGAEPPRLDDAAPLEELLPVAYLTVLAGDAEARLRAWEMVQERLEAQPLPGVQMAGETEDARVAAALIFLVADSTVRTEAGAVHVLPALPADWAGEGVLARLTDFPSGLGPIRLDATVAKDGAVTLSLPKTPKLAQRLLVSPPLGAECTGLRANGRPVPPETFGAGPPWSLDPSIWSVVLLPPP